MLEKSEANVKGLKKKIKVWQSTARQRKIRIVEKGIFSSVRCICASYLALLAALQALGYNLVNCCSSV